MEEETLLLEEDEHGIWEELAELNFNILFVEGKVTLRIGVRTNIGN